MLKNEIARASYQLPGPVTRDIPAKETIATHWLCLKTCAAVNFHLRAERPILAVARERRGWRCRRGGARVEVRAHGDTCCRTPFAQARLGWMGAGTAFHKSYDPSPSCGLSVRGGGRLGLPNTELLSIG